MNDNVIAVPVERTERVSIRRIGLVGAVAAALVAVAILAAGAGAAPSGTLAAADAAGSAVLSAAQAATGLPDGPDGPGGFMRGHRGGMGGFHDIAISAISGSSISLKTDDGWTRTISVNSATTYDVNGTSASLSDLKVGDEVRFQQTRQSDGTYTIDAIAVIPPHAGGTVTDASGSSIKVTQPDRTAATITVTSATTYEVNGTIGALADIKAGMVVMASGTSGADGSLTATQVRAFDSGTMRGPGGDDDRDGHGPHGPWGSSGGSTPGDAPATTPGSAG